MVILGAKGHAKEILQIIPDKIKKSIVFFDNVSGYDDSELLYHQFRIINNFNDLEAYFKSNNPIFCTGIGSTIVKSELVKKIESLGGKFTTVIAKSAIIGDYDVVIAKGCNIMEHVFISNSVSIGEGCLINHGAALHHDSNIGNYCEISPRVSILGRCKIGNFVSIGANSTIMPDIVIGNHAIIGAGTLVLKNVPDNTVVVGVPGRIIKSNE